MMFLAAKLSLICNRKTLFFMNRFPALGILQVFVKRLEIKKTKTTFITSVLKVEYFVVLVLSISNYFNNKNSQRRKLSAKEIPSCGKSALVKSNTVRSLFGRIYGSAGGPICFWYKLTFSLEK